MGLGYLPIHGFVDSYGLHVGFHIPVSPMDPSWVLKFNQRQLPLHTPPCRDCIDTMASNHFPQPAPFRTFRTLGWSIKNPTFREANHLHNQSVSGAVYIYSLNAQWHSVRIRYVFIVRSTSFLHAKLLHKLRNLGISSLSSFHLFQLAQDDYLGCNPKPCKSFGVVEKTTFSSINSEQSTICVTRHQNLRVRSTRIWSCKNVVSSFSPVFRWGGACGSL